MWQRAFVNDYVILRKMAKPVDGRTSYQVGINALHLGRNVLWQWSKDRQMDFKVQKCTEGQNNAYSDHT